MTEQYLKVIMVALIMCCLILIWQNVQKFIPLQLLTSYAKITIFLTKDSEYCTKRKTILSSNRARLVYSKVYLTKLGEWGLNLDYQNKIQPRNHLKYQMQ